MLDLLFELWVIVLCLERLNLRRQIWFEWYKFDIVGYRKLLIDGDRIEIDEIKYILGDQNHKIERNQNNLY